MSMAATAFGPQKTGTSEPRNGSFGEEIMMTTYKIYI